MTKPAPTLDEKLSDVFDELENPHSRTLLMVTLGVSLKEDELLARGLGITMGELHRARKEIREKIDLWNRAQNVVREKTR